MGSPTAWTGSRPEERPNYNPCFRAGVGVGGESGQVGLPREGAPEEVDVV